MSLVLCSLSFPEAMLSPGLAIFIGSLKKIELKADAHLQFLVDRCIGEKSMGKRRTPTHSPSLVLKYSLLLVLAYVSMYRILFYRRERVDFDIK